MAVRVDGYPHGDFRRQYCVGETYTEYTDPCQLMHHSGIEVWSKQELLKKDNARIRPNHKILKVKIDYKDLSLLTYFELWANCSKVTVIEEV